jgi:signal transduction histidine kinase
VLEILKFENPEAYSNEYIQLLEKGVENLKDTIVHLTDLVEQGFAEQNDFKEVALQLYIERNKNGVITLAMEKGVEIINDVDDQIKVHVIPGYLDSILVNFMTNAIKYCNHNKESYVRISAETSEDFVVLIFEDNGLGIDLEKNGIHLFAMFKTFHESEDSRGLGLYITKNQIESMGGNVEVESEPYVGTTFKVYLPKSKTD